uniref:HHLA1 neighbor of OC90 n=1 Tax=Oryzias melastigma TaxID=30732 RepID=A0A3B3DWB1_ORYME
MAGSWRSKHHSRLALLTTLSAVSLLFLLSRAFRLEHEADRHKRDFPDPSDTPAVQIDPAAIDLTSLVNTLINSSQTGSQQLFSLLSVTSYSSLALHKLTLLVYNISSLRGVDSGVFRRRFCYCVTNQTSDLTDFTAVLLDVMGNSTSHLQELFKSSSFLSVSQRNDSDCIFICVMAGKTGRDIPDLWRDGSITPLFNQTIVESPHTVANMSSLELPAEWNQQSINLSHAAPSGMSSTLISRDASTVTLEQKVALNEVTAGRPPTTFVPQTPTAGRQVTPRTTQRFSTPSGGTETSASPPRTTTATSTSDSTPLRTHSSSSSSTAPVPGPTSAASSQLPSEAHTAASGPSLLTAAATRTAAPQTSAAAATRFPPIQPTASSSASRRSTGRRATAPNTLVQTEEAGCPWRRPAPNSESHPSSTTAVGVHKLQPCIFELCKFFSQCLCSQRTHTKRFCSDSHLWYEEHTAEVCRRVRRISFSRRAPFFWMIMFG